MVRHLLGAGRSGLVAGQPDQHMGTATSRAPLWPHCPPVMCILKWMYLGGEMEGCKLGMTRGALSFG